VNTNKKKQEREGKCRGRDIINAGHVSSCPETGSSAARAEIRPGPLIAAGRSRKTEGGSRIAWLDACQDVRRREVKRKRTPRGINDARGDGDKEKAVR